MTISVKKIKKLLLGALSLGAALVLFAAPVPALATCGPVALDPGHGGNDPGASSGKYVLLDKELVESHLTWQVAHYCKERLDQLGIPNFIVKEKWESLSRIQRWQRAKAKDARVLISFHMNAADGIPSANGSEVLCCNFST